MRRTFTALFSCLAILSGIAGTASGAYVDATSKSRVGVSERNPDIHTYVLGSLELEPQRGDTIVGYDPATGVVFYVNQNPWTKFDPLGLFETAGDNADEVDRTPKSRVNSDGKVRMIDGGDEYNSTEVTVINTIHFGSESPENLQRELESVDPDGLMTPNIINGAMSQETRDYWEKVGMVGPGLASSERGGMNPNVKNTSSPQIKNKGSGGVPESQQEVVQNHKKPDYTQIGDPKNVNASTKPTVRQVREMKRMNMEANNGVLRDDKTGETMSPSAKSQKGVTPPSNEVQVDHIVPVDKGGTRTMENLELRTRANNRKKWNQ